MWTAIFPGVICPLRVASRHVCWGGTLNGRFWPKADPENWSFAVVKASALPSEPDIQLVLVKRSANDPFRPFAGPEIDQFSVSAISSGLNSNSRPTRYAAHVN